ncbi:hypothetical protein QYF36_023371 [Acer negundo]|nr:hypothetical protein QYF36_023371 [Acer negundo]
MAGTAASPLVDVVCDRLDSHGRALSKNACFRNSFSSWPNYRPFYRTPNVLDPTRIPLSGLGSSPSSETSLTILIYDDIGIAFDKSNVIDSRLSDDDIVLGRNFDFDDIVSTMFQNNDEDKLRFIPIVGMGRIGKTVLARKIYNDEWVESHFQIRVWVNVGGYLDIATVIEAIAIKHKTLTSENSLLLGLNSQACLLDIHVVFVDMFNTAPVILRNPRLQKPKIANIVAIIR